VNRKPLSIVVVGGRHISPEACEIAYAIGRSVVERGHILMTGGTSGSDECAARGAFEYLQGTGRDPKRHIIAFSIALDYHYKGKISPLEFRQLYPGQNQPESIADWVVKLAERLVPNPEASTQHESQQSRRIGQNAPSIRDALGLDRPDQIAATIQASLTKGRPRLFSVGGLCAGYPLEPSPGEYFVAHEFSEEKIGDLRHALEQGFTVTQLKPYTADQDIRPGHILCKIAAKIQTTAFCIFDLPESQNRNVYLELGIAIGLGRPFVLVKSARAQVPSLVEGLDYFGFTSYTGLRQEVGERVQVGQFSAILPQEDTFITDTYFVADGEFEQEDFRQSIRNALQDYGLRPAYLAEGQVGPELALSQLIRNIQVARFGIYRIDEEASANTFLALGIAIGLNKPWLLVAREGATVPVDVRGLSNFNFRAFLHLEEEFAERCREFLRRYDGTSVEGEAERAKPRLVWLQGHKRCVYLIENDVRHWVPDPQTLGAIRRGQEIEELTLEELQAFRRGEPLKSVVQPGKLQAVQLYGRDEAYLIEDGKRRWIPDLTTLGSVVGWEKVEELLSEEELEAFPLGEPLEKRERSAGVLDYEHGLQQLRESLTEHAPAMMSEFYPLEARLLDNLRAERLYGSTETIRSERARVMDALNDLAGRAGLESSFNDLCRVA